MNKSLLRLGLALAVELTMGSGFADPAPFPAINGTYQALSSHPRVFTTQAELKDLVDRVGRPNSFSAKIFAQLATKIKSDLSANVDWTAVYSGCDINMYLHLFSYEPAEGYADQVRSAGELKEGAHVKGNAEAPRGAAVVCARLALYAALLHAGAAAPPGAPSAENAEKVAKAILESWAVAGFKTKEGAYLSSSSQFCAHGKPDLGVQTSVGLQVSRGIVYSVAAQDLLMSLNMLDADAVKQLDAFHKAMYDLIRDAHNFDFSGRSAWHQDCDKYSNHIASQLTGLLAVARLTGDSARFAAALDGSGSANGIKLPWEAYFDRAVYGDRQKPNACYPNSGPDGQSSHPSFDTPTASLGEIDDRYRNANTSQGIGYAMGTLEWLYRSAEILRIAGYDAYAYRGSKGQSIEAATRFYACYGREAGFGKVVTAENAKSCSNVAQYEGKIVSGVDSNIVIGAYRFPDDPVITSLEVSAKNTGSSRLSDPLLFGRWRD